MQKKSKSDATNKDGSRRGTTEEGSRSKIEKNPAIGEG